MKLKHYVIGIVTALLLTVLICCCIVQLAYAAPGMPPMTGYITVKSFHPEYYPATALTPWVYELIITSPDGQRGQTWRVDMETYNSYTEGDYVERGVRKNTGDVER